MTTEKSDGSVSPSRRKSRCWNRRPWGSRSILRLLALLLLAILLPLPVASEGPSGFALQQEDRPTPTFRAAVDVVNVLVTVRDRKGDYQTQLTRDDFEIFEDGLRQEIEFFGFQSGAEAEPLSIVLLIDTSGSVKDLLSFQQQAALEFFETILRPKLDMAAVVQFDSEINLVQDFTFDLKRLESSIQDIRGGGATKLYDAVWVATEDLLQHEVGRRVMVILSDGDDTQSQFSDRDVIQKAQLKDVMIYGIGIRNPQYPANFRRLRSFAESTGGLFVNSRLSLPELRNAFGRINEEIRNQYSLGYVSTNQGADRSFREIQVRVKQRGLKVTHRRGYYPPEVSS